MCESGGKKKIFEAACGGLHVYVCVVCSTIPGMTFHENSKPLTRGATANFSAQGVLR